jgi:hypothetical protein
MAEMTEQLIISSVKVGKDKDGKDQELHLKTLVQVSSYGDLNKIVTDVERPRAKLSCDEGSQGEFHHVHRCVLQA